MELDEIRKQINETDDKILELFTHRMELAALVAKYKTEHDIPVLNAAREQEILERNAKKVPKQFSEYCTEVYKTLFAVSRDYQEKIIEENKNRCI